MTYVLHFSISWTNTFLLVKNIRIINNICNLKCTLIFPGKGSSKRSTSSLFIQTSHLFGSQSIPQFKSKKFFFFYILKKQLFVNFILFQCSWYYICMYDFTETKNGWRRHFHSGFTGFRNITSDQPYRVCLNIVFV